MRERIADGSIDLTVTSPPYDNLRMYKGYTFDFEAIAAQLWRVTKPGGIVVWVVADATINGSETGTSFRQALYFMGLGFNLHDTMIYDKGSFRYPQDNLYHQIFEYMFVLSKGHPNTINLISDRKAMWDDSHTRQMKREASGEITWRTSAHTKAGSMVRRFNIWRYAVGGGHVAEEKQAHEHPAIFPEALARDHIASWSNPGDLVLDPMCGSGTTIKMAVLAQRRAIGIDIAQEYIELTQQRVDKARAQLHLFPLTSNQEIKLTRTGLAGSEVDSSDEAQPVLSEV
jgi:DNA modification methylase